MPLFTQSTLPWVSAVFQVADSGGATGDTEMTQRAHISLRSAFQYFNNRTRWNYLRTEANPQQLVAPFSVTGITASAGQSSAAAPAGHGFQIDDIIFASGLIAGARVSATAASGIGFFTTITGYSAGTQVITATGIRDSYDLPSDWRGTYSVRLLGSEQALRYINRRVWDRSVTTDYQAGTPSRYDLFNSFGRSKIRILPAPSSPDVMVHRYQRRMFLASASGVTTAIDIPEDYEAYPVAWAKWHFLTDKREQGGQQAQTWLALAQEGLKTMMADDSNIRDEDLIMLPGHIVLDPAGGDRSTRYMDWES